MTLTRSTSTSSSPPPLSSSSPSSSNSYPFHSLYHHPLSSSPGLCLLPSGSHFLWSFLQWLERWLRCFLDNAKVKAFLVLLRTLTWTKTIEHLGSEMQPYRLKNQNYKPSVQIKTHSIFHNIILNNM